jgi:acetolactate synthase-1/2/3 large subunit
LKSIDILKTPIIYNNSIYGILETEYLRLGVNEIGRRAASMFDLSNPAVNHVDKARGMGVDGERVDTLDGFIEALTRSFAQSGPYLIEAML